MTEEKIDRRTRERIRANLKRLIDERRFRSVNAMAAKTGVSRSALGRVLNNAGRTCGFDIAIKVRRTLGVSLDMLVDQDPPAEYFFDEPVQDWIRRRPWYSSSHPNPRPAPPPALAAGREPGGGRAHNK